MGDFVTEQEQEFEVDKKKFGYKPVTAGEENDWINEYLVPYQDEEGNTRYKQDIGKLNKCKMRNLKKVPWSKEEIKKTIEIDKDWKDMTHENRWKLISKLKPSIFSEIISNIDEIDKPKKKEN